MTIFLLDHEEFSVQNIRVGIIRMKCQRLIVNQLVLNHASKETYKNDKLKLS